jgi:hypothetical protein
MDVIQSYPHLIKVRIAPLIDSIGLFAAPFTAPLSHGFPFVVLAGRSMKIVNHNTLVSTICIVIFCWVDFVR